MPITEAARKAIDAVLKSLEPAVGSLRGRKDFGKKNAPFDVPAMVVLLSKFQQDLMSCRISDDQKRVGPLAENTATSVIPAIQAMMESNTKMALMGQLNTNRTIEPEEAKGQNLLLGKLQQDSMQLVASAQVEVQPPSATVAIRSITYTSRHGGPMNKLLRPNGATTYYRMDGQNIQTRLDDSGGQYHNAEWEVGRAAEPFSQDKDTAPAVSVVCRVTAQGGNVTVTGFAGQLDGTPWNDGGLQMLTNNFQIGLDQATVNPNAPAVVNDGAYTDFTVTFTGAQDFPDEIGVATLALTLTAQTDAGNPTATANAAGSVFLTFAAPAGDVQSQAANVFTGGGAAQHVTPARLALAIRAVRLGRNAINVGGGATRATHGVPNFAFGTATDCVDAIFLFLKSRGIQFSLNYRWVPALNSTGFWAKPPLHTYLWMSLSPSAVNAPLGLPRTEAWAECHNLAVAFALMGEVLGLGPFVFNGQQPGYAVDYAQPRRQDIAPYNAQLVASHGLLNQAYQRVMPGPGVLLLFEQLCFIDQNGGINNFEGVAVFNDVRLYPLGECILAENNRGHNADNYYCLYLGYPDYVDPTQNVPNNFDNTRGLVQLVFSARWLQWFFNNGGAYLNWQNGYDFDPYPTSGIAVNFMWED